MVIGEAPGAEEDMQGAPFVGRAGKLLDRMLAAAGLEGRVFITNTVFWRPPGNRNPTPQEQLVCAPFLERAIALVQPRLLMLAGGAAAKALLQRPEGHFRPARPVVRLDARATGASHCRPCRRCTPRSCSASRRRRNGPGRT